MAQIASAEASGVVQPLYQGTPAPMGLADYGLSSTGSGALSGSVLATTRVLGAVAANATGLQQLDLYNEGLGPDAYSIQLNAVLTGVTLFGSNSTVGIAGERAPFDFWTQNVFEYYPSARLVVLATNVWNFSGHSRLAMRSTPTAPTASFMATRFTRPRSPIRTSATPSICHSTSTRAS